MSADNRALAGFVGFANLPNQVHRRSVKRGFTFTALVIGESGLGKSTFVNTLFATAVYPPRTKQMPSADTPTQVVIRQQTADVEERGVKLKLNVLDTPGYGDFINNEASWKPIVECIDSRFDAYLDQERRVNRKTIIDNRIHCALYFIAPTGHALKALDIETMKQIHEKVNLIPVIAKADTLTKEEMAAFKKRILEDMAFHNIKHFQIRTDDEDDQETIATAKELQSKMPFAVVGSEQEFDIEGKKVRGRKYPWGVIEVENEEHNDFVKLRQLLIRSHMEDLIAHTNEALYEHYRTAKLTASGGGSTAEGGANMSSPLARFDEEKKQQEQRLKKMEAEMRSVFQEKVKLKDQKLKQAEEKLNKEHAELKDKLEKEKRELDEKNKLLEEANRIAQAAKSAPTKEKKKSGIF